MEEEAEGVTKMTEQVLEADVQAEVPEAKETKPKKEATEPFPAVDALAECPEPTETQTDEPKKDEDEMKNVYHVKWIEWTGEKSPVVTQNENGPCPLLAIFNVLLLSKKIILGNAVEFISSSQIISRIADVIWDSMPEDLPDDERLNYEQNISDAMAVFPNLQTGLDVNVKFSGVSCFEYTPELTVFDLLRIPLYHGWLVDPQDTQTKEVLGDMSYNQVVEKVITFMSSEEQESVEKGLVAQQFLESTASQITCHGIVSLREELQPGSLAVLFRNNHFSTIHRHKDELFTLITDLGFLKERDVVWESLSSVQGDSIFVDGNFVDSPPKRETTLSPESLQSTDHDYELALSMQQEQIVASAEPSNQPDASSKSDYKLAMELQQQEEVASQRAQAGQPRPEGEPRYSDSGSELKGSSQVSPESRNQSDVSFKSDYELAMQLQRQEEEIASQRAQSAGLPRPTGDPRSSDSRSDTRRSSQDSSRSKCVIL